MTPLLRTTLRHLALMATAFGLAACARFHSVAIGPGGQPVSSLKKGTAVDLRFASARRLDARTSNARQGLPPNVIRLVGTVERTHDDTVFVRIEQAAPLGGKLHGVSPAVSAPVVIDRDVAVRVRR